MIQEFTAPTSQVDHAYRCRGHHRLEIRELTHSRRNVLFCNQHRMFTKVMILYEERKWCDVSFSNREKPKRDLHLP